VGGRGSEKGRLIPGKYFDLEGAAERVGVR